jgi:hypothetical protein
MKFGIEGLYEFPLYRVPRVVTRNAQDQNARQTFREDLIALKNGVVRPYRGSRCCLF